MVNCKIVVIDDNCEPDMGGDKLGLFIDDKMIVSFGKHQAGEFKEVSPDNQLLFNCISRMMEQAYEEGGNAKLEELRKFYWM